MLSLLVGYAWSDARLPVLVLYSLYHLYRTFCIVFSASGQVEAVHTIHVVELATAQLAGYALGDGIVVFGEALVVDDEVRRHIQCVVIRIVVVQSLLGPVDVHPLQRSVAPDGARARVVVGVARGVAVVVQQHQPVLLVPHHRAGRAVACHQHRIAVGVVRVAVGANLRGGVGLFSLVKVLQIV